MSDVDIKEPYQNDSKYDTKHPHVAASAVDTAAAVVSGNEGELEHGEAMRIRKKIDWHILPLMCGELCNICTLSRSLILCSPLLDPVYGQDYLGQRSYSGDQAGHPFEYEPVRAFLRVFDCCLITQLSLQTDITGRLLDLKV
jgi:hypothetical protein